MLGFGLRLTLLVGVLGQEEWYGPSSQKLCYVIFTGYGAQTFDDARTKCETVDAYIPVLENTLTSGQAAEIDYIYNQASRNIAQIIDRRTKASADTFWLGYRTTASGSWMADNGMPIAWTNWASADTSGGKDCTAVDTTNANKWSTSTCGATHHVVCQKFVECTAVVPANGAMSPAKPAFLPNEQMTFTCNPGFRMVGPTATTCSCDGSWVEPLPSCEPVTCKTFGIANAVMQPDDDVIGNVFYKDGQGVTITCKPGYVLEGPSKVTCEYKDAPQNTIAGWDTAVPFCRLVTCHYFAEPYNGKVSYSAEPVIPGTVATFTCDEGYVIENRALTNNTCARVGDYGEWLSPAPYCVVACPYHDLLGTCWSTGGLLFLAVCGTLIFLYLVTLLYSLIVGPKYIEPQKPDGVKEE